MLAIEKPIRRVARILVINKRRQILLARQTLRQLWHFPGGNVKPNENPWAAALRGMADETGLIIVELELIRIEFIEHPHEVEEVWCFHGITKTNRRARPDESEIDQLKWYSLRAAQGISLTDTTRLLLQNISIIKLFVR